MPICYCCFSPLEELVCPHCGAEASAYPDRRRAMAPGSLLRERYIVGYAFAEDALAITYFGYDRLNKKTVWIREYLPEGLAGRQGGGAGLMPLEGAARTLFEKGRSVFIERAKSLERYNACPGMARMECFFEENGTVYLIADRPQGVSLAAYMKKRGGFLPWPEARRIMEPVAGLLAAMHDENAVHGGVEPSNVYIAKDGAGMLLHFGLPGIPDPKADVRGAAATLYYLLSGQKAGPAPAPLSGKGVPVHVEKSIFQALERADEESMRVFVRALSGDGHVHAAQPAKTRKAKHEKDTRKAAQRPRPERKRAVWLVPVLGLTLLCAGGVLIGLRYVNAQRLYREGVAAYESNDAGRAVSCFEAAMNAFPWADDRYEDMYHRAKAMDYADQAREYAEGKEETGQKSDAQTLYQSALLSIDKQDYLGAYRALVEAAEGDPDTAEYREQADAIYPLAEKQFFYGVLLAENYADSNYLFSAVITPGPEDTRSVDTLPYGCDCLCMALDTPLTLEISVNFFRITGLSADDYDYLAGIDQTVAPDDMWVYSGPQDGVDFPAGNYCVEASLRDDGTLIARQYVRVMAEGELPGTE